MRLRLMLAALLCAAPVPALAQVTATYKAEGGKELRIEAAANGDYRIELGKVVVLRIGREEYVAVTSGGGVPPVTKFRDALALVKAEMEKREKATNVPSADDIPEGEDPLNEEVASTEGESAVGDDAAADASADAVADAEMEAAVDAMGPAADAGEAPGEDTPADYKVEIDYRLERKGEESVGGRSGVGWDLVAEVTLGGKPMEAPAGQEDSMAKRAVMSRDPELAPLAAPFRLGVDVLISIVGSSFGEDTNFPAKIAELLKEGVPIRYARDLVLVSAKAGPIDPARLALPGPVIQAEDFLPRVVPQGSGGGGMPPLP